MCKSLALFFTSCLNLYTSLEFAKPQYDLQEARGAPEPILQCDLGKTITKPAVGSFQAAPLLLGLAVRAGRGAQRLTGLKEEGPPWRSSFTVSPSPSSSPISSS